MNVHIGKRTTVVALLLALLIAPDVSLACGESLYRVGKGVSYRAYSAPIPANIVVYAGWERSEEVATLLAAAGHSVRVVDDQADLDRTLAESDADVVLAPLAVGASMRDGATLAFLPVVEKGSVDEVAAKARYERLVRTDANIKTYLKQIHLSLTPA